MNSGFLLKLFQPSKHIRDKRASCAKLYVQPLPPPTHPPTLVWQHGCDAITYRKSLIKFVGEGNKAGGAEMELLDDKDDIHVRKTAFFFLQPDAR